MYFLLPTFFFGRFTSLRAETSFVSSKSLLLATSRLIFLPSGRLASLVLRFLGAEDSFSISSSSSVIGMRWIRHHSLWKNTLRPPCLGLPLCKKNVRKENRNQLGL